MSGILRAPWRVHVCGVVALLLLTGCGDAAGQGGPSPSSSASGEGGRYGGGSTGTTPTALPTDLRECPPEDKGTTGVRVPTSVANVGFEVPAGFTSVGTGGLGQIQAAEGDDYDDTYYMLEVAVGVENIALVHYRTLAGGPVADQCDRLDLEEVLARLADHNERSGSKVTSKPELIEMAGVPVVVEERTYPTVGITVRHYWIYASADMLNIQCQWTSHEAEVRTGCDSLIASLSLG